MMKGISFDGVHSYRDLNLVLSEVSIPPAAPKLNFIDVPNGDGSVDLTEAVGDVRYSSREATFTFTALPQDDFEAKKTEVSNLINGMRFDRIIVDKDPDYYWTGRCKINEYASDKNIHKIVVMAILAPYKHKVDETIVTVQSGEDIVATLDNGRKKVIPIITTTADAHIVFGDLSFDINAGTHQSTGIILTYGKNIVTVTSTEAVKFTYREGDL